MAYAIKAEVHDLAAMSFVFEAHKTMYGGKHVAEGDVVYVFASETSGGCGLIARGRVTSAHPVPRSPDLTRQTPRVSVAVAVGDRPKRPLGRAGLKPHADWASDDPAAELNFKLYRQATDKVVGLSGRAAAFLESYF
jgi:hypothetical protein